MAKIARAPHPFSQTTYAAFSLALAVTSVSAHAQQPAPGLSPEVYAACEAELEAARSHNAASHTALAQIRAHLAEENVRRSQLPDQIQMLFSRIVSEFRAQLSSEDQARLQSFGRDHAAIMALNGGQTRFSGSAGSGDLIEHASSFLASRFNRQGDSMWTTLRQAIQTVSGRDPRPEAISIRAFAFDYAFQTVNAEGVARPMNARIELYFVGERQTPLIQMEATVDVDSTTRSHFLRFGLMGATSRGTVPGVHAAANLLTGSIAYAGATVFDLTGLNYIANQRETRRPQPQSLVCQLLNDRGLIPGLPR